MLLIKAEKAFLCAAKRGLLILKQFYKSKNNLPFFRPSKLIKQVPAIKLNFGIIKTDLAFFLPKNLALKHWWLNSLLQMLKTTIIIIFLQVVSCQKNKILLLFKAVRSRKK